jgi:DNA-binding transcriptional regulator PaaX
MQPKTEEFLNLLLWSADRLLRPSFRNLTDSYESWAYRTGLWRQTGLLERKHYIEGDPAKPGDRIYRLTRQGRLHALGGRDPADQWSRKWDGRWRLVLFDIPVARNTQRAQLRSYLRNQGFGCLQKSVWITPHSLDLERNILTGGKINVVSLVLMEARPCAGESDADIVAGAWDFERINYRYARHLRILERRPTAVLDGDTSAWAMLRWAEEERLAWLDAVEHDPLLPERIHPPGYLGRLAWQGRIRVLEEAGRQLRAFRR